MWGPQWNDCQVGAHSSNFTLGLTVLIIMIFLWPISQSSHHWGPHMVQIFKISTVVSKCSKSSEIDTPSKPKVVSNLQTNQSCFTSSNMFKVVSESFRCSPLQNPKLFHIFNMFPISRVSSIGVPWRQAASAGMIWCFVRIPGRSISHIAAEAAWYTSRKYVYIYIYSCQFRL